MRVLLAFLLFIAPLSGQYIDWIYDLKNRPIVDVRAYGATGDGATDDTTAIQNAINAAASIKRCLVIPGGTYKVTAALTVTSPACIYGAGETSTIIAATSTTADILTISANPVDISNLGLRYTTNSAKTAGAALHVADGGKCLCRQMFIEPSFNGIQMDGSSSGDFEDIFIGETASTPANANWNAAVLLAGTAAKTVTDTNFRHLIISIDRACAANGCVVLDGATDTIHFDNLEVIAEGTCRPAGAGTCGAMMLFQNTIAGTDNPRWVRCVGCAFEAGINDPAIKVTDGKDIRFEAGYAASGQNELLITDVNGFSWLNGVMLQSNQELVKITGGAEIDLRHSRFSGASQEATNTYDAISVAADLGRIHIVGNDFGGGLFSYTAFARYYVTFAAGTGDDYTIALNMFDATQRATGDINDLALGDRRTQLSNTTGDNILFTDLRLGITGATTALWLGNDIRIRRSAADSMQLSSGALANGLILSPEHATMQGVYPVLGGYSGAGDNAVSLAWGDGSGYTFRMGTNVTGTFTDRYTFYDDGRLTVAGIAFAAINLISTTNGTILYCSDCTVTGAGDNTCAGSGNGALAIRLNGAWRCFNAQN